MGTAIARFFGIPYPDVMALHESGVGFGVIARAYMTAKFFNGQLTPREALELFQSGLGRATLLLYHCRQVNPVGHNG